MRLFSVIWWSKNNLQWFFWCTKCKMNTFRRILVCVICVFVIIYKLTHIQSMIIANEKFERMPFNRFRFSSFYFSLVRTDTSAHLCNVQGTSETLWNDYLFIRSFLITDVWISEAIVYKCFRSSNIFSCRKQEKKTLSIACCCRFKNRFSIVCIFTNWTKEFSFVSCLSMSLQMAIYSYTRSMVDQMAPDLPQNFNQWMSIDEIFTQSMQKCDKK